MTSQQGKKVKHQSFNQKKGKKNGSPHKSKSASKHNRKESGSNSGKRSNKYNGKHSKRDIRLTDNSSSTFGKVFPYDARDSKTSHGLTNQQSVPGVQNNTIVSPTLTYQALLGLSLPVISYAYQGGISDYADARNIPGLPYYAVIYMTKIFEAYVLNKTPPATKVPLWMAIIGNALRPKIVQFKSGNISYSWQYSPNETQLSPSVAIGKPTWNVQETGNFYMYLISNQDSTGLNVCVSPPEYTDERGEQSFGILSVFFSSKNFPLWKNVSFDAGGEFNTDASAFSYPITVLGYGNAEGGAWGLSTGNEVPIFHPLLGVFASQGQLVRYPKFYRNIAGDSILLSGFLQMYNSPKILKMKNQIVLKSIDFYEIVDVVCKWLALLFRAQRASTLQTISFEYENIGMTYFDLVLLLRSYCVQMFGTTQHAVQSLFPRAPTNNNGNIFIPLLTGSNCHACNDAGGLLLPVLLVENLKCLTARQINAQFVPKTGKPFRNNPLVYMPVLGVYSNGELSPSTYVYPNGEGNTSIFAPINDGLENLISPVDGSVNNAVYQISNTGYVSGLAATFNRVVSSLRTFSMTLDQQGESQGINALQVITMTNVLINSSVSVTTSKGGKEITFSGRTTDKMIRHKKLLQRSISSARITELGAYATQAVVATTSQVSFNKSAWSEIQTLWIRPVSAIFIGSTTNDNSDTYSAAVYGNEPYILHARDSYNPDSNLTSLETAHDNLAAQMVKGAMGGELQIEALLKHWAAKGRGGLLSGLVDMVSKILPI